MKKLSIILSRFLLGCFISIPLSIFATHERAAEITYHHLSGLTYEFTLLSYTFTPSPANAYRDFLTINWGDGTTSDIPRVQIIHLPNEISYNKYIGQHTFPGPSTFIVSCEDPNRNGGIINIPNSINIPMYIYSEVVINPFLGYNDSPVLLNPPIDNGCVDQPFYHNPGAYDDDNDSLSYSLVTCRGAQGQPIPGYFLPPASHSIHIDSITGDFFWDSPEQQGEFNIAILIQEWRNGQKIGSVLRDMQIIIVACNNHPPVIEVKDTCIEAGKTLTFQVHAYDPDSDFLALSATGGPFLLPNSPAIFSPNPAFGQNHTQGTFTWPTICNQVLYHPYSVYFRAADSSKPVSLVDIKTMRIKVIGPPPENLTATPLGNTVTLNWDNYACQNAKGYYIYRKPDSTGFVPGYCQTGVPPGLGYVQIDVLNDITKTTYLDNNNGQGLVVGVKYCYLIVAWYADNAESYASNEACATLKKDIAVLTNVSINTTSTTTGSVYIAWSKPTQIDSLQAPGPYEYKVIRSRSDNPGNFLILDSLFNLNDTIFTDSLINTQDFSYSYRIELYNLTPGHRFFIGTSQVASSMFLRIAPTDKRLILTWTNNVPWINNRFIIYRKNPGSASYDSVGNSTKPFFTDKHLVNGKEYCYVIRSVGKYSASGYVFPIINYSQSTCAVPIDNVPPCPPNLRVRADCIESVNHLSWINPYDSCSGDIAKYYVYYSSCQSGKYLMIDSLMNHFDSTYNHKPQYTIAGCYCVVAVDSVGNRSTASDTVCIDVSACSAYKLPNIFTPNGDTVNDTFHPFRNYTSVEKVEMTVFDRWGKVVFETQDPNINWDGRDRTTKLPCSDGVYFYVCNVYEVTLCGTVKRVLRGSVTILR